MQRSPTVELEMDDDLNGIVAAQCPRCANRLKSPVAQLGPAAELACPCGGVVALDRNDLRVFQRMVNNLRSAARDLAQRAGSAPHPPV